MSELLSVPVQKLSPDAIVPTRTKPNDAGFDLSTIEDFKIAPGERYLASTGLALAIPPGYVGQVCPRSGLALKHGLTIVNSPGIIDADYRGMVKVILLNTGTSPVEFKKGDRIAQLVIIKLAPVVLTEVSSLNETSRGTSGFGSSGV